MKKKKNRLHTFKNRRKFPKLHISPDGCIVDGVGYTYHPTRGWRRLNLRENRFNLAVFMVRNLRRRGT